MEIHLEQGPGVILRRQFPLMPEQLDLVDWNVQLRRHGALNVAYSLLVFNPSALGTLGDLRGGMRATDRTSQVMGGHFLPRRNVTKI